MRIIATLSVATVCACAPEPNEAELIQDWVGQDQQALRNGHPLIEGRRLFAEETFGGNGRTCQTCHAVGSGTMTLRDIRRLYHQNPGNPLFRHDGLDDDGIGVSRILSEGTIRVTLELPWYVTHGDNPTQRTIDVFRGIPSTLNTPGLDPALMYDLRNETLEDQAAGAIAAHAQATVAPTPQQLGLIADFQQRAPRFYSSFELFRYSRGGPEPTLPPGRTPAERRGRRMFVDAPFNPPSRDGICAMCHSGPMLNSTNEHGAAVFPAVEGTRFHPVFAGDHNVGRNLLNHPVHNLLVDDGLGNIVAVSTTDPGVMFTERVLPPPAILPRNVPTGFFKTPQLWGVKDTSPYFHDNSAPDLDAVMEQYQVFFDIDPFIGGQIHLSAQDKRDAVAYMKLLR